jgi:cytochrome c-type biogenesis protein CcmF
MIIHPPSLYTGFTSSAVPFAFAIAALATGRLDNEWIVASRKWMLFSWLFLSIGNALGMLWAYDELGWGGYWAWDPVENAAFLPWLTASAYVHSIMIQERRGMLKIWNVFLICLTFFLTIFGTFLTRSGLIASVHSFAQSGIGIYFVYFMGFIIAVCAALIIYRLPRLRSEGSYDSALSLVRLGSLSRSGVPVQQLGLREPHGVHRGRNDVATDQRVAARSEVDARSAVL